jgi:hypothetical protein
MTAFIIKRVIALALAALVLTVWPADAATDLFADRNLFAEIFELADVAQSHCPGLHVIEDNVRGAADAVGVDDDVIYSPEWRLWESRGKQLASEAYAKDPVGFCNRMWRFLGPDHPPMVRFQLLRKEE